MAHYAILDGNNVVNVILANSLGDAQAVAGGLTVVESTEATNPAAIGGTYDSSAKKFIGIQPYPSWTLNSDFIWQPPVALPKDGKLYGWDEDTTTWVAEVTEPGVK